MARVIGLISGTSIDGIDAALVEISGTTADLRVELLAAKTYPYPEALRAQILAVAGGAALSIPDLACLDDAIAAQFAQAAIAIQSGQLPAELIGSHGQTVYHRPPGVSDRELGAKTTSNAAISNPPLGYSVQLGRGALIARLTGITTVSNFRTADIDLGGQGAPLVPSVDACLLRHPSFDRCVQNVGGIGNVAYLPAYSKVTENSSENCLMPQALPIVGWDTGPGNSLLDLAVQHLSQGEKTFDQDGAWAASGTPCVALVEHWLQQDFFQQPPPKSTGRELFGQVYLDRCFEDAAVYHLSPADILATLTELTATSIAHSYRHFLPQLPDQVLLCGGGSHNRYLHQRLQIHLDGVAVLTTDAVGLNADFKEAIAFAVLGYWRMHEIPSNLPEVTGAIRAALLGEIHLSAEIGA